MKLRGKVLVFLFSIVVLSGGMIVVLSHRTVHTILIGEVGKRVLLKSQELPATMTPGFLASDEALLLPLLQKSVDQTGAVYAMALDLNGHVLAHTNVVEKGKRYRDLITLEAIGSDQPVYRQTAVEGRPVLDVSLPVWTARQADPSEAFLLSGGQAPGEKMRVGTLRIGLPLDETLQTMDHISRQITWIIAGSAGLSVVLALVLMRGMLKRVRLLAEGTERISRGEYGAAIPVLAQDELGELAVSFNRMSQQLERSHDHLEQEVKARTQELETFVYTVSHDLKSPVVSMNGIACILKEEVAGQLDETGRQYIDRIIVNANYMEELIHGLLELSRIGKKQGTGKRAEVAEVVQEVLDIHRERFAKQGVELVVHTPLPSYVSDQVQLTQLFQNLISNAAKFMGDQSQPRIEIGGRALEDGTEFYVRDNGIGIDPAYQEKIFTIFQRLQEVSVEGTGVGLAIVKKIVDLCGGTIRVESKKGEGATFFIRFPRKDQRPAGP